MTQLSTAGDAGTPATNGPIAFLLLNIRVNPRVAQRLMAAGVTVVNQSRERGEQVVQRHVEQAEAAGRDAFRGGRTDQTGKRVADSGIPLFGWNELGRQLVCLKYVIADLGAMGMRIVSTNLRQKQGDNMLSWFVKFQVGEAAQIGGSVLAVELGQALGSVYEHVHGYRNPDTSVTINPSHRIDEHQVPDDAIYDLRILPDGHVRNIKRGK